MFIKPTIKASGSIFDIHESTNELLLYPTDSDVPCPWDADILVDNGKVTVIGNMGPGGSVLARCTCEFKVDYFTQFYKLEVPDTIASDESFIKALEAAGWIEV